MRTLLCVIAGTALVDVLVHWLVREYIAHRFGQLLAGYAPPAAPRWPQL